MTINVQIPHHEFVWLADVAYGFPFRCDDPAWFHVEVNNVNLDPATSYGTLILNVDQTANPGGTFQFVPPIAVNDVVVFERHTTVDQQVDLTPYGAFPSETVEFAHDKTVMMIQDLIAGILDNTLFDISLDDLSDVDLTGQSAGDVLTNVDGSTWVAAPPASQPSMLIQAYTPGSYNWTKPAGAQMIEVFCIGGGGGGGGGGHRAAGTSCGGGGGGGGAGQGRQRIDPNILPGSPSTTPIVVGAGGPGGAGAVGPGANGTDGTTGGDTFFGASLVRGNGGLRGIGGSNNGGTGGAAGSTFGYGDFMRGLNGGSGGAAGGAADGELMTYVVSSGNYLTSALLPCGGGGGGGGRTAGGGIATFGASSLFASSTMSTPHTGIGLWANILVGQDGGPNWLGSGYGGGGGGSGGGNGTPNAGLGGPPGGGGGGGFGTQDGSTTGNGGNGGPGLCVVITHF